MKKVLMVVFSHFPADPRVNKEVFSLCKRGIAVDILCLKGFKEIPVEHLSQVVTVYRIMKSPKSKESISRYLASTFLFFLKAFFWIQVHSIKPYSLFQAHNMPDFLVFCGLKFFFSKKPIILDLHDLSFELFESKWALKKHRFILPIIKWVEKISCGFAHHILTTSIGFQNKLLERGVAKNKITLIINTADETLFKRKTESDINKKSDNNSIIYHGSVKERFGLESVLKAIAIVRKTIPQIKLFIYGIYDPSYKIILEDTIQKHKLEKNVQLHGYVKLEQLPALLRKADIGIVPYLDDKFMNLALSTKGFEYACSGVPVIASALEPMKSLFSSDAVEYYKAGDSEDLARKIIKLCQDTHYAKQKADKAYLIHHKISWGIMAERYSNLIKNMLF